MGRWLREAGAYRPDPYLRRQFADSTPPRAKGPEAMRAYWLTFKPHGPSAPRGWPIEELRDLVRRFNITPSAATEWWRIASHRSAQSGDRVYLFKQGDNPRGIFGLGTIIGGPENRSVPSDDLGPVPRALVRFERLVDPSTEFLLRLEEIEDVVPPTLINAQASGNSVADEVASEIEKRLELWGGPSIPPIADGDGDSDTFDPDSAYDARERAIRAIRIRRGQPAFRAALLKAYGGRCVITGCKIVDVLEAAHIVPYMGPLTNDVRNGLLLRSDLHTLFDCDLLAVHPKTRRVVIAESLQASTYSQFSDRRLRSPLDDSLGPSTRVLQLRFANFQKLRKLTVGVGVPAP
jgi:putative restriction endonuclease